MHNARASHQLRRRSPSEATGATMPRSTPSVPASGSCASWSREGATGSRRANGSTPPPRVRSPCRSPSRSGCSGPRSWGACTAPACAVRSSASTPMAVERYGRERGSAYGVQPRATRLVPHCSGRSRGWWGSGVERLGALAGLARGAAIRRRHADGRLGDQPPCWPTRGVRVPRLEGRAPWRNPLGGLLARARGRPPVVRAATVGLLTTLLPCGWLYTFVFAAAGTGARRTSDGDDGALLGRDAPGDGGRRLWCAATHRRPPRPASAGDCRRRRRPRIAHDLRAAATPRIGATAPARRMPMSRCTARRCRTCRWLLRRPRRATQMSTVASARRRTWSRHSGGVAHSAPATAPRPLDAATESRARTARSPCPLALRRRGRQVRRSAAPAVAPRTTSFTKADWRTTTISARAVRRRSPVSTRSYDEFDHEAFFARHVTPLPTDCRASSSSSKGCTAHPASGWSSASRCCCRESRAPNSTSDARWPTVEWDASAIPLSRSRTHARLARIPAAPVPRRATRCRAPRRGARGTGAHRRGRRDRHQRDAPGAGALQRAARRRDGRRSSRASSASSRWCSRSWPWPSRGASSSPARGPRSAPARCTWTFPSHSRSAPASCAGRSTPSPTAGPIYFDGVTLLIFLLLVGRYLQQRGTRAATDASELLLSLTPQGARVVEARRDGAASSRLPRCCRE